MVMGVSLSAMNSLSASLYVLIWRRSCAIDVIGVSVIDAIRRFLSLVKGRYDMNARSPTPYWAMDGRRLGSSICAEIGLGRSYRIDV
jgi:hypothetical protein